ncbi:MAG: hypothetical protein M1832_000567 [Thelocarpon impressellum]|nr:MAG: hypothetical protein M1832_000567 [Thelocarpon impressellum]
MWINCASDPECAPKKAFGLRPAVTTRSTLGNLLKLVEHKCWYYISTQKRASSEPSEDSWKVSGVLPDLVAYNETHCVARTPGKLNSFDDGGRMLNLTQLKADIAAAKTGAGAVAPFPAPTPRGPTGTQ